MSLILPAKKKLLIAQKSGLRVEDVFNTSIWTGNAANRIITTGVDSGEGSLVWIKARNWAAGLHRLFDTIRGAGNRISSNLSEGEGNSSNELTAFSSTGYSLGDSNYTNGNAVSQTYVGWQFRRAPKFFDFVQYTGNGVAGRQIAHDLAASPGMILVKRLSNSSNWAAYHSAMGGTKWASLNGTESFSSQTNIWNDTNPTESHFSVGSGSLVNANGDRYIAYLFAHDPSPDGLIQCDSYVGNGSATGPVINLGWRPQYLMIKGATSSTGWQIFDAARGLAGPSVGFLYANLDAAESSVAVASALHSISSGFQINSPSGAINGNGQTYIYMTIPEAA